MVKNIRMDKAFLSHTGLSPEFGASIHDSAGVAFGRAVMENSRMNIGLYPSEKLGKNSVHSVCRAEDYDLVITDENAPEDFLAQMAEIKVNVLYIGYRNPCLRQKHHSGVFIPRAAFADDFKGQD